MVFGMPVQMAFADPNPSANTVPTSANVTGSNTAVTWTGDGTLNPSLDTAVGNTIINWNNFDIGQNASVTFTQGGGWVLNNISPANSAATGIFGKLTAANCGLIVQNPYGVVFGPRSLVSAKSFMALGLTMDMTQFVEQGAAFDPLNFEYGALGEVGGDIELQRGWVQTGYYWWQGYYSQAEIQVDQTAALIGKNIFNKGIISAAANANVVLAAGERVLITRQGSKVMAEVSAPIPESFIVSNEPAGMYGSPRGRIDAAGGHVVLAAGDIYSTAIEGVETLRATAIYDIEFSGPLSASAVAASDAVAEIDILAGGTLNLGGDITVTADGQGIGNASALVNIETGDTFVLNQDITATAQTGGDFDADAKISIKSNDGGIDILTPNISDGDNYATRVEAKAFDGVNNSAQVDLIANGDVRLLGTNEIRVLAEAYNGQLNQAAVNVQGSNVEVRGQDFGVTDAPAQLKAYAHNGEQNVAAVDIVATDGDVTIIGEGGNDDGLVTAMALNGIENTANITINAAGDVEVLATAGAQQTTMDGGAIVKAQAGIGLDGEQQAELNEAGIVITANNVLVKDDATDIGQADPAMIIADAYEGAVNNASVDITAAGDVTVYDTAGASNTAKIAATAGFGEDNTADIAINAGGNVLVFAGDGGSASIEASAMYADNTNTASIAIDAGGDVEVISVGGSTAAITASAQYAENTNTAEIEINAGGNVLVLDEAGVSETAKIKAVAQDGYDNTAGILVNAGGDVKVIAKDGGKAQIKAIAKDADNDNTASIEINSGGDVKVIAKDGGKAEVSAIAVDAGNTNSASVEINAEGDVKVIADGGSIEEWTVDEGQLEDQGQYVDEGQLEDQGQFENVWNEGSEGWELVYGRYWNGHRWTTGWHWEYVVTPGYWSQEWVENWVWVPNMVWHENLVWVPNLVDYSSFLGASKASIESIAKEAGSMNTALVDITAGKGVSVLGLAGGKAEIEAKAAYAYNSTNTANIDILAQGGDVLVGAFGGTETTEDGYTTGKASVSATAEDAGGKGEMDGTNTANITIVAKEYIEEIEILPDTYEDRFLPATIVEEVHGGNVKVIAKDGKAEVEAIAKNSAENTAGVDITADADVSVKGISGEAEITALAKNALTNTATVDIAAGGDVDVYATKGGEAEIEAKAKNQGDLWMFVTEQEQPVEEEGQEPEVLLVVDGLVNTATVNITAANVTVEAEKGGEAVIGAQASNEIYFDGGGQKSPDMAEDNGNGNGNDNGNGNPEPSNDVITIKSITNTATVDIEATGTEYTEMVETEEGLVEQVFVEGGDVRVIADKGGEAEIYAEAFNEIESDGGYVTFVYQPSYTDIELEGPISNSARVLIDAADDVKVDASKGGEAGIFAEAWNDSSLYTDDVVLITNFANVAINAGDDVKVKADKGGEAEIYAGASGGIDNVAGVVVNAGDKVSVSAKDAHAWLGAEAFWGIYNSADVAIDADGVKVKADGWDDTDAGIYADTWSGEYNTSSVALGGVGHKIGQGGVSVKAEDGAEAYIGAYAEGGHEDAINDADVLICTEGDVKVKADGDYGCGHTGAYIEAIAMEGYQNNASVAMGVDGSVLVQGIAGGEASILSGAYFGFENTASTIVCAKGNIEVFGISGYAEIASDALNGFNNEAYTGVAAEGDVIVAAESYYDDKMPAVAEKGDIRLPQGGTALIRSNAGQDFYDNGPVQVASVELQQIPMGSSTASATTVVFSKQGNVYVNANNYGTAGITSEATGAMDNDAYTGVCAQGNVFVNAYSGGNAMISSEASGFFGDYGFVDAKQVDTVGMPNGEMEPTTADAETVVIANEGGVQVSASGWDSEATIVSNAHDAMLNTAYTGVASDGVMSEEGSIVVSAGDWGNASIESIANGGFGNAAETVICTQENILVEQSGFGYARIKARVDYAPWGSNNYATTRLYASAVDVQGWGAWVGSLTPGIWQGENGGWNWDGENWVWGYHWTDDDAAVNKSFADTTLIIDDYASRENCPDCPPCPGCPCDEDIPSDDPDNPAAPLYTEAGQPIEPFEFGPGGCPALMSWFADEVGIPVDQIQVMFGGADYLATDIQPCDACARLKQQADMMAGLDPEMVDAWASTVRAALVGPPTPEMIAGIQTALADNPAALNFDSAAAEYVRIMNEELGVTSEDAVATLTSKYAPADADLVAYINARLGI